MSQIPTCPTGCSFLPILDFDVCAPVTSFGEIHTIYLAPADADPFANWDELAEWTTRVSNDSVVDDGSVIRQLTVIADLPMATSDEIILPKGAKIQSPASHVINVAVYDLSDDNYEFARKTSCNTRFRMWFANNSYLYGGNEGILCYVNLRPVIETGTKTINKLMGTITWDAQFSAERCVSPFAVAY